jgi:type III restriction enzyme
MPRKQLMLELKVFQSKAAKAIANRYSYFASHPNRPKKGDKSRPYFQALSALTGAGKTPILAEAVAQMRAHFGSEPIVFWISKAKSVVAQTFTNFSGGGKYCEIIDGFRVINASQLNPHLISDSSAPLLVLATTGLFNSKDQAAGALNIYKRDQDLFGDLSPWERLIKRSDGKNRRPLIIVYDEGHNLSDQQTEILSELEPDAYLLASATLTLPANFNKSVVQPITLWVEESGADAASFAVIGACGSGGKPDASLFITTAVDSVAVVDAELVKKAIQFNGTTSTMETSINDLCARMRTLEGEIKDRGLGFLPKAIYVCKTNITDDGDKDDHAKPFQQRNAPPIRIWRHLVEEQNVDPANIAIYANLAFAKGSKPDVVNLFSGGESDFDDFSAGDFQHIIFNLALQEGWDDPACYLAYIDKSMGSTIQVEQVIGRVLRQPGAKHYDSALLNSAHFFIRVDKKTVFEQAINAVKSKLQSEGAPIEIIGNFGGASGGGADDLRPKEEAAVALCHVNASAEAACARIAEIIDEFPTFAEGGIDTVGEAHSASELVDLKALSTESSQPQWTSNGNTNPVRLRWFVNTALRSRSSRALAVTDLNLKKFDTRVQVHSNANKAAEKLAAEIVDAYYEHSELVYESVHPFKFGTVRVPKNAISFSNGLYERYYGFNKFELAFAHALDECEFTWHRNPSNGGFHIPLLSDGDTASFFPDFIVWKGGKIFCLDTKGSHLLSDAVARKLFDIQEDGKTKIQVRFITEGYQKQLLSKAVGGGYTVWKMKTGTPSAIHVDSLEKAVKECLK